MKNLYNWTLSWAEHTRAKLALFFFAFIEAIFFPIPPDPLLVLMTAVDARDWLKFAVIATFGSVAGALVGYFIGLFFYDSFGKSIISFYGFENSFLELKESFNGNSFLAIFIAAFSPIPFKVFTIAAGTFKSSFLVFILAAFVGRGLRFFIVAAVISYFGKRGHDFIEKHFNVLASAFAILLIVGFIMIKFFI
ncbi:MAG: hypothetical protein A3H02_00550 [Candidatus Niyogibacteria bacterium RIFCSPLOWO2_12_FULL_41_13]|uniref:VTT domain-containing protein n=1 Tax=Candidatus Niyogibacteria bacterium RIFCSPLOWO2_12_FULL_41_13 TaxID=1801726 RepID=A0A1G2F326_9BACT|nr:MAG: hypothetical protein A3H02_00550 [Candidatus Niyogibacteria bacterium RIFCSPLOWO2_12_FULL_41_13]